jgi:5-methylcytosine-specific restriction enzyme subunit McrC
MYKLGDFGTDSPFSAALRQKLRKLIYAMEGISIVDINRETFQRKQFGRNDRDYRVMLSICKLFSQKRIPSDRSGEIIINEINRGELKLFNVFELFVTHFYNYHLCGWDVQHEKHFFWHEQQKDDFLPIMKPDIFLSERGNGYAIFLDTKFTKQTGTNQWGSESYHSGHLYQIYSYVKSQENHLNFHPHVSGILLYPLTNETNKTRKIQLPDHNIVLACVDLTQDWNSIEAQLLSLIPTN